MWPLFIREGRGIDRNLARPALRASAAGENFLKFICCITGFGIICGHRKGLFRGSSSPTFQYYFRSFENDAPFFSGLKNSALFSVLPKCCAIFTRFKMAHYFLSFENDAPFLVDSKQRAIFHASEMLRRFYPFQNGALFPIHRKWCAVFSGLKNSALFSVVLKCCATSSVFVAAYFKFLKNDAPFLVLSIRRAFGAKICAPFFRLYTHSKWRAFGAHI